MAIRVENFPKKIFDHQETSMPHFPSCWLPNGREINFSFSNKSNSVASKPESPTGNGSEENRLGLQLTDRDSSPTQSVGHSPQPHQDARAAKVVNSQEQSYSSESGQDDSCGRSMDGQMKPFLLYGTTSENMFNPSQVDHGHPMVLRQVQVPYGVADPYLGGLLTTYGPHAIIGNQMMGMATNRVPLPLNLAVDGPIYVNAKQYHGILRRRQSRAKLEAQNKLVKTRKPYLHESRHLHALNRVRGTGGRFLSTKKTQPPNMASHQNHGSGGGDGHHFPPSTTCSEIASASNSGSMFLNSDRTGLRISGSMVQRTLGLMFGASGNRSSSVQ